jgi:hypothetical protein
MKISKNHQNESLWLIKLFSIDPKDVDLRPLSIVETVTWTSESVKAKFIAIGARISLTLFIGNFHATCNFNAKFPLSSFYPEGFRQIFQVNFRIFLKKFQNFPILKKVLNRAF